MARRIVAGPPCAGKSSYCTEHAMAGDLVYDYDLVHSALSLQPSHQHDDRIRPFVLAARDAIYAELENAPGQSAWIITSTRRSEELRALSERLDAQVVLIGVSQDEAHRRCDASGRPQAWHSYIDNWFEQSDIDPEEWPMAETQEDPKSAGGAISPTVLSASIDIELAEMESR